MSKCETGFVGGHLGESGLVFNFDARTCFIDIVRPTSKTPWQELKKFGILPALIWTYSTSIFSKSPRNTSKWQSNKPHGFLDLHHCALIQLSFSGVWRTEGRMLLWLMQSCQWHLTEIRRNFVIPGKLPEFLFSVKSSYLKLFFLVLVDFSQNSGSTGEILGEILGKKMLEAPGLCQRQNFVVRFWTDWWWTIGCPDWRGMVLEWCFVFF